MIGLRLAAAGAVLALLLAVVGGSRYQVARARADAAEAREQATALQARLESQSAEVDRWRREAELRSRRAHEAYKQAGVYRQQTEAAAMRLEGLSTAGMDECDALRSLVDLGRRR
jgi:multidrug resistance efflux pump